MCAGVTLAQKSYFPRPRSAEYFTGSALTYRISVKPSARSNSSQTYCGAKQMTGILPNRTVVVSSAGSAARSREAGRLAAPIAAMALNTRRLVCICGIGPPLSSLCLHFALQLVQGPPVGALGNDPLRRLLDHAELVQPQCVKPHAVFGVIFPPIAIGVLVQRLQCVIEA